MPSRRLLALLLIVMIAPLSQADMAPFDSGRWVLYDAEITEHLGRQSLVGSAYLPDANFTDGIIEYDLAVDGSRGYPGITFRAVSAQAYENIYCRPHVPNRPDALQYTPVFNGVAGWQLYNGPGFTAPVPIPAGEWIHVRIEILGQRGRVFFGDMETPALVIDDLKHEARAGSIGIKSEHRPTAFVSEFQITHTTDLDFGPAPEKVYPRGLIQEWEISQGFLATDVDASVYPEQAVLEQVTWQRVAAEPTGLVDIARHVPRRRGQTELVFARLVLNAEQAETRQLSLGYSDMAWVYLNGRPLFAGNSAYRSRDETFSGIIGLEDALYLPLDKGENELLVAVLETFGGWGIMGQDNDDDFFAAGLNEQWRQSTGHRVPESVLHDPAENVLYVTQFFNGGGEFISRLSLDGEILDREWAGGLSRPTGMIIHDGDLWVVDRASLVRIDRKDGSIIARHPIPEARFPNDVAFDDQGRGYVTDTRAHCIHRFKDGEFSTWFTGEEIGQPNGLLMDGDRLLYGNQKDGCLKAVDLQDQSVTVVARLGTDANVDGIRHDGAGGFLVSDFNGRLFRAQPDGDLELLLDTTASGAYCADFEFVPSLGLLVVPGLYDNTLTAYQWEESGR